MLPTTIQDVSSEFNVGATDRRAIHSVDGSGLDTSTTPPSHTNQPNGTMWLNTGDGSAGGTPDPHINGDLAQITFNLGGLSSVDSFRVWNYNELNGFNNRSANTHDHFDCDERGRAIHASNRSEQHDDNVYVFTSAGDNWLPRSTRHVSDSVSGGVCQVRHQNKLWPRA